MQLFIEDRGNLFQKIGLKIKSYAAGTKKPQQSKSLRFSLFLGQWGPEKFILQTLPHPCMPHIGTQGKWKAIRILT